MIKKRFLSNGIFLFVLVLAPLIIVIFKPLFFESKIPFSANLLASFYNPWAQKKFLGWENGIPNKPVGIDDLRIFYPQRSFTTEMLKQLKIPLWNPYSFSGNTHVALSETAVFYPLALIFLVLPQLSSWIILIIIQPILASIGTYLYLYLVLKDKKSALFGAIAFGFSGVVIVRMVEGLSVGHTLIWLPLIFFGIEGFLQKHKIRYLYIAFLAMFLSLLAGWFQFTFYLYAFSFLYAVFRIFNRNIAKIEKRNLLVFIPFILLPLATLYQIIPALQMLYMSPRVLNTYSIVSPHLMPLQHLLTYIFPDLWGNPGSYNFFGPSEYKESILYIGLAPVILSLISIFKFRSNKFIQFFSLSTLIALLLGFNNPLSDFLIRLPIPIVSSFLPDRIFLIATFSLSVLAAFGLNYLIKNYKTIKIKQFLLPLLIIGILIFAVDVYIALLLIANKIATHSINPSTFVKVFNHYLWQLGLITKEWQISIQFKNILLPNLLFISLLIIFFIKRKINSSAIFVLLILLTIFGQIYFAQKYISFSEKQFVFPKDQVFSYLQKNSEINRFISTGEGYISAEFPLFFRLYTPDGVSSMYLNRYGELVNYMQNQGKFLENIPRIEARINPSSKLLFGLNDKYLLRFMQIDGIKYVVKLKAEKDKDTGIITNGNQLLSLAWQNDKWQIFKFKNALPRIFWTAKYEVIKNDKSLLSRLFNEKSDPKTILLEKDVDFKTDTNSAGSVQILEYSPNTIKFNVHSNGNGFVFLSDNYVPQFKAAIDGKPGSIFRADYSFRAIPVKAGDHSIILYYDSKGIELEILAAAISIIVVFLGSMFLIIRKIISL